MGTKPSYFKIGLFVILAGALVLAAVVVFGAGLLVQEKLYFETYFDESVTGLTEGAPVELRGVRIGLVDKITFVREHYGLPAWDSGMPMSEHYVMVLCSVDQENLPAEPGTQRQCLEEMVDRGLRVRISSNLLTGQAYLQADYLDPNRFDLLEVSWEPKNLYMPSAPSEFSTLKDSVDKVLRRLQELEIDKLISTVEAVLSSIDSAIADADVGEISKEMKVLLTEARTQVRNLDTRKISLSAQDAFDSADKAVQDVNTAAIGNEIQSLLAEVRRTNEHLQRLLVGPEAEIPTANMVEVLSRLNKTLVRLDRLVATERPQIGLILANFEKISEDIRDLTETLKKHPSSLFFSEPPSHREVPNER